MLARHAANRWLGCLVPWYSGTITAKQKELLWDTHTGTLLQVWEGHEAFIYAVAFTPDGQTLATTSADGVICLWDVRAPTQPRLAATLRRHSDRVFAIAFSADGRRLVSSSADRTVAVWDMQSWQRIRIMQGHIHLVWAVGISPEGRQVASGGPMKRCVFGIQGVGHVWRS